MTEATGSCIEVCCAYAYQDRYWLDEFTMHLSALRRQGVITLWHDQAVNAESSWEQEMNRHVKTAQVILLLISPDFLASGYCHGPEMCLALERHKAGDARVIPLILHPVLWMNTPLSQLDVLPLDGKPISTWAYSDEAFYTIAKTIREVVKERLDARPRVHATGAIHARHCQEMSVASHLQPSHALASGSGQKNRSLKHKIFVAYAQGDKAMYRELEKHLLYLQHQRAITMVFNRQIAPGIDWTQVADQRLSEAALILLLISPEFLASDYCSAPEMQRALERHKAGDARVIPLILRPVDWPGTPFAHLQCLPDDALPVTLWNDQDTAFITIAKGIRAALQEVGNASSNQFVRSETWRDCSHRERFLGRVSAFWIDGVLEHSLEQTIHIDLGLQERPDALKDSWRLVIQEGQQPVYPLPASTPITRVYEAAYGELLILGEPGAGKTTLLLELARDLIQRALVDETHPMPVVCNLASWARGRQPLSEWLVDELHTTYLVPQKMARKWVRTDQLLILLDGLDEVDETCRKACIMAINAYRTDHKVVPVVVCSRRLEYLDQPTQLQLYRAVEIYPLTEQQINAYVSLAGERLEGLRLAFQRDPALLDRASTPLMLSMLILASQEKFADAHLSSNASALQQRVFAGYVQRMLKRRSIPASSSYQQMMHGLTWLARQLVQHNQVVFRVDHMKSDWLPKLRVRRVYIVLVAFVVGVIYGLAAGTAGGFVERSWIWLGAGAGIGVCVGLFGGFLGTIFDRDTRFLQTERRLYSSLCARSSVFVVLRNAIAIALVAWLVLGLIGLLMCGSVFGIYLILSSGGLDRLRSLFLRVFLWCGGLLPWNYGRFLDLATERALLCKVGGGYMFIHRSLLEYFASLDTPESHLHMIERTDRTFLQK